MLYRRYDGSKYGYHLHSNFDDAIFVEYANKKWQCSRRTNGWERKKTKLFDMESNGTEESD